MFTNTHTQKHTQTVSSPHHSGVFKNNEKPLWIGRKFAPSLLIKDPDCVNSFHASMSKWTVFTYELPKSEFSPFSSLQDFSWEKDYATKRFFLRSQTRCRGIFWKILTINDYYLIHKIHLKPKTFKPVNNRKRKRNQNKKFDRFN